MYDLVKLESKNTLEKNQKNHAISDFSHFERLQISGYTTARLAFTILFQMRTTLLYESVIGNRVPFQEMKNRPCRMCCLVRAVLLSIQKISRFLR